MTAYTYAESDFVALTGGATVDTRCLRNAVAAGISAKPLKPGYAGACWINDDADPTYQFDFVGTLSGAEETTLDGIVAAHIGPCMLAGDFIQAHMWDPTSNAKRYLPWGNSDNDATSITWSTTRMWLPMAYRLMRVKIWSTDGAPGSGSIVGLHINSNTTPQSSVTLNMAAEDTPYTADFSTESNLTVESQAVALSFHPGTGTPTMTAWSLWRRA